MSYTPGSDFDFTGLSGYTPDSDFDFSEGSAQPYYLGFDQDWSLTAPTVQVGALDQDWVLTAATDAALSFDQDWALTAYLFADLHADQSWVLNAPVFRNHVAALAWTLRAPVFNSALFDAAWALQSPVFADASLHQQWALITPTFANRLQDFKWALVAPQGGNVALDQQWRLDASAVWTRVISSTAYIFALEQGAARDEIPMANFSGQFRSGSPSYLQVSIPDAGTHAATIQAYAALDNVEMVIDAGYLYSDGDYQTQEIARVTLRNIRYDYGSRSSSVSLDGTDTRTNPSPKAVTLTGSSYLNIDTDGRLRYRVRPDFSVRPGDTVTVDGDTFTAGEISWQVNSTSATMEVAG